MTGSAEVSGSMIAFVERFGAEDVGIYNIVDQLGQRVGLTRTELFRGEDDIRVQSAIPDQRRWKSFIIVNQALGCTTAGAREG